MKLMNTLIIHMESPKSPNDSIFTFAVSSSRATAKLDFEPDMRDPQGGLGEEVLKHQGRS